MDPLSITALSLTLAKICLVVGNELYEFVKDADIVGTAINALHQDVKEFEKILQLMYKTVEEPRIKTTLTASGFIGTYWENLKVSLQDAEKTLKALEGVIQGVNRDARVLEKARKTRRLKGATGEIEVYQQQIRAYKDTIQVSLQTTILWNQVQTNETAETVIPTLDQIVIMLRTLTVDFNSRMDSLEETISSNSKSDGGSSDTAVEDTAHLQTLTILKTCLKSAASVVSSTSEIYNRGTSTQGSDFGDLFPPEPNDLMLGWIEENRIEEEDESDFDEQGIKHSAAQPPIPTIEWDSDGEDEELEFIEALYHQGVSKHKGDKTTEAERDLQNCIDRLAATKWTRSLPEHVEKLRFDAMSALVESFRLQEKWEQAEPILMEKITLSFSKGHKEGEATSIDDVMLLSEVLFQKKDYTQALLYGRRAYRLLRKQDPINQDKCAQAVQALSRICHLQGDQRNAEAYIALLSHKYNSQSPVVPAVPELDLSNLEMYAKFARSTQEQELQHAAAMESISHVNEKRIRDNEALHAWKLEEQEHAFKMHKKKLVEILDQRHHENVDQIRQEHEAEMKAYQNREAENNKRHTQDMSKLARDHEAAIKAYQDREAENKARNYNEMRKLELFMQERESAIAGSIKYDQKCRETLAITQSHQLTFIMKLINLRHIRKRGEYRAHLVFTNLLHRIRLRCSFKEYDELKARHDDGAARNDQLQNEIKLLEEEVYFYKRARDPAMTRSSRGQVRYKPLPYHKSSEDVLLRDQGSNSDHALLEQRFQSHYGLKNDQTLRKLISPTNSQSSFALPSPVRAPPETSSTTVSPADSGPLIPEGTAANPNGPKRTPQKRVGFLGRLMAGDQLGREQTKLDKPKKKYGPQGVVHVEGNRDQTRLDEQKKKPRYRPRSERGHGGGES